MDNDCIFLRPQLGDSDAADSLSKGLYVLFIFYALVVWIIYP